MVKNLPAGVGDVREKVDSWVGKIPGGGPGSPPQYSCPENPQEPGGLQSIGLHRVGHD